MRRVWLLISQVAFRSQAVGVFFNIAGVSEVSRALPARILPVAEALFVPPFGVFRLPIFLKPGEPSAPCCCAAATVYPLGNCDSPGCETRPGYLTRFGTVSHRSSPLSPFFAFTDGARTPPEELVNPASVTMPCGFYSGGAAPTSLAQPFPSRLGLSSGLPSSFLRPIPSAPVLSMNC